MLKLKLPYFGHLMQTADSLEKSLILGKTEGRRRRGHQRIRWLSGITNAMDMNLGKLREMTRERQGMPQSTGLQRVGHDWLLNNNEAEASTGSSTLSFLFLFGKLTSKSSCLVF